MTLPVIAKENDRGRAWRPWWATLLICGVALTRYCFRSHYLYDIDSVDFALALRRFDPAVFQPHPPGYFLYICLGRLANLFISDGNGALTAISILASCGAAIMIYLLTKEWFGEGPALVSIALFLVSPLCWFHGIVALIYIVEAFFSALTGYLCWRACSGEKAFLVPASMAFALAAGFRPSTALLLAPLWLFTVWRERGIRLILAILAVLAVTFAWFLPMIAAAGGLRPYFEALAHLWVTVPGRRTTLSSPWLAIARILTMVWIFVLILGPAIVFAAGPKTGSASGQARRAGFVWAWVAPGALFFAFVFLNFVNSGYLLLLCPPVFALVSAGLYAFLSAHTHRGLRWSGVALGIAANCALFFFAPLYCSLRSVRAFETNLAAITEDFARGLDPKDTLIVGFDAHFQGYRHAGYYLPGFVVAQYPEVAYPEGKRVFVMRQRSTEVVSRLPIGSSSRFVLFPLPDGADYAAYLSGVQSKLPAGTLHERIIGRQTVLEGPISALPLLFPTTTPAPSSAREPGRHDKYGTSRKFRAVQNRPGVYGPSPQSVNSVNER